MMIKRLVQKTSSNCSCCGNKSVKPFEILIINNNMQEHMFLICNNCQKNENMETKEIINNLSDNKLFIS
jgi:transcription elongation factor Elf1